MLASYVGKWLEINGTPKEVEKVMGYLYKKENGRRWLQGMDEETITAMVTYHFSKDNIDDS